MDLIPRFLGRRGNYGGEGWLIPHNEGAAIRPHDIEYARNMAGHTMDYALGRGDFAPIPKKSKTEHIEQMEADSTSQQVTPQNISAMGGIADANGGHRGTLAGNTQTNKGYEKHYHERQICYSKKLKLRNMTWGMSIFGPKDRDSGALFPFEKFGTVGSGGKATPGIVYVKASQIQGNDTINPFTPFGSNQVQNNFCENIYSNAINFKFKDFFDDKLLSDDGTKGIFKQYNKFRLLSFTIEIIPNSRYETITHMAANVLDSARNNNGFESTITAIEKAEFASTSLNFEDDQVDSGYFIYRDQYASYSDSNNNIPYVPPDSKADVTSASKFRREQFVIKNLDHNLTYVKSGETFSFTRKIKPMGGYYFTRDSIIANKDTNIANIVNLLEGQVTTGTTIINKLLEGFNLLIVPGDVKIYFQGKVTITGSIVGYIPLVQLTTSLEIRTKATWEAFDYNYAENSIQAISDSYQEPLEKALFDYNITQSVELAQLNRS